MPSFRVVLPDQSNELGKQVKRALNKPQDPIDLQSEATSSHDEDFDPQEDDRQYDQHSGDPEPEPVAESSRSYSKRKKSSKSKHRKGRKNKRARSNREPTDSSDFDTQSEYSDQSNYSDEYNKIQI